MVWYFIGVYMINSTLHGCLEIRNFSSHEENISLGLVRGWLIREIYMLQLIFYPR